MGGDEDSLPPRGTRGPVSNLCLQGEEPAPHPYFYALFSRVLALWGVLKPKEKGFLFSEGTAEPT